MNSDSYNQLRQKPSSIEVYPRGNQGSLLKVSRVADIRDTWTKHSIILETFRIQWRTI